MDKRLFRNEHEKVIAGVSSGIAEYMEVDVTIIRLLFVLSTIFLVGTGILVYLIMWIVVPVNNDPTRRFSRFNDFYQGQQNNPFSNPNPFSQPSGNPGSTGTGQGWTSSTVNDGGFKAAPKPEDFQPFKKNNETGRTVGGMFLLVIGIYFLMNEFNFIPFWFSLGKLWPLVFVAIGVSFILKANKKNAWEQWKRQQEQDMYADIRSRDTNPVTPSEQPTDTPVAEAPVTDTPVADVPNEEPRQEGPKIDDRFTKRDI
ncbi:PspC domain-containing protein [Pedobacter frigoris]|uniref:PspC domain-containing protein n=1 Tax=Pedobacter frigoris TaxID=2571272 RepID=UPI00292DC0C4|nr:PspC domain-containing protein [Pedobacter frigoris]